MHMFSIYNIAAHIYENRLTKKKPPTQNEKFIKARNEKEINTKMRRNE